MADLRIFSYLPNPRIYKASIAARLCGVDIEIRGDKPMALADWLWDYDALPLTDALREQHAESARHARKGFTGTLYKTDAFLAAHPWGTVPAAFGDDGAVGVFESNSIMRAVARMDRNDSGLYGHDAMSASRIDAFLDTALVFALASQTYLLMLRGDAVDSEIHAATAEALAHWLGGLERALGTSDHIAGDHLTLADICLGCELLLMENERHAQTRLGDAGLTRLLANLSSEYPRVFAHYGALCSHPAFAPDFEPFLQALPAAQNGA